MGNRATKHQQLIDQPTTAQPERNIVDQEIHVLFLQKVIIERIREMSDQYAVICESQAQGQSDKQQQLHDLLAKVHLLKDRIQTTYTNLDSHTIQVGLATLEQMQTNILGQITTA